MKKILIILLLFGMMITLCSVSDGYWKEKEISPIEDAKADILESKTTMVHSIMSFVSSTIFATLIHLAINKSLQKDQMESVSSLFFTSGVCCLSNVLLAYLSNPKVPEKNIEGKDSLYISEYSEYYRKHLKYRNTLYTAITGLAGYILCVIFSFTN